MIRSVYFRSLLLTGLPLVVAWLAVSAMSMIDPQPLRDSRAERYFIPAGSGSRHLVFPGVEIRTTAGRGMMLSVVHLEPDAVVPDHAHPHEQIGIMILGRLEFTVGGITRVLGPGDIWRIPGGVVHWRIPGGVVHRVKAMGERAMALDVFHPVREDYL